MCVACAFEHISEKGFPTETVLTINQGKGTLPRKDSGRLIQYNQDSLDTYKLVKQDDFIIHLRSFEAGFEMAHEQGIVSPAYTILRGMAMVVPSYFRHYFRTDEFIRQVLVKCVEGIRDGRQISYNQLKGMMIPIPPVIVQKKVAFILDQMDSKLSCEEARLNTMNRYKNGLFQRMFI